MAAADIKGTIQYKDETKKAFKQATKNVQGFSKQVEKTEKGLGSLARTGLKEVAAGVAGFFAFSQAASFMQEATRAAIDFEKQMRNVNTINKFSEERLEEFTRSVSELQKTLPQTNKEIGDTLFFVASAGVEASKQLDVLTLSSAGALAAGTDMKTAFDGVSAVIKGFGKDFSETSDVLDKFFKINELGQTTVGAVSVAIQKVAPVAKSAGVSLDELSAIFATFTGVTGGANEVSTQAVGAINALAAPTAEARKKFDELGVEVGQAAIEEKGFAQVAKDVFDAVGGNVEQLRKLVPEVQASLLITSLASTQFETYGDKLDAVKNSSGALEEALRQQTKTTAFQLQIMNKQYDDFKKKAGSAFKSVAVGAGQMAQGIASLVRLVAKSMSFAATSIDDFVKGAVDSLKNVGKFFKDVFTKGPAKATQEFFKSQQKVAKKTYSGIEKSLKSVQGEFKTLNKLATDPNSLATDEYLNKVKQAAKGLNETGKATGGVTEKTKGLNEQINNLSKGSGLSSLSSSVEGVASKYNSLRERASIALDSLEVKHAENTVSINSKIEDLKVSLDDLQLKYNQTINGIDLTVGEKVIAQEEKIKNLRAELQKQGAKGEDQSETLAKLQKEEEALKGFGTRRAEFEDEIAEAKRRRDLTEFERAIEDADKRRELETANFEQKQEQLNEEIRIQQENLSKEKSIFEEKKSFYESNLNAFDEMSKGIESGFATMSGTVASNVDKIKTQLAEMEAAFKRVKFIGASVVKSESALGVETEDFAGRRRNGGFVQGKKPFLVGEEGPEMFIPSSGGRVEPTAQPKNEIKVEINISGNSFDSQARANEMAKMITEKLTRNLELNRVGAF